MLIVHPAFRAFFWYFTWSGMPTIRYKVGIKVDDPSTHIGSTRQAAVSKSPPPLLNSTCEVGISPFTWIYSVLLDWECRQDDLIFPLVSPFQISQSSKLKTQDVSAGSVNDKRARIQMMGLYLRRIKVLLNNLLCFTVCEVTKWIIRAFIY